MTRDLHSLVLGAGPAGLASGVRLARAGLPVAVVDKRARPGGLSASFSFEDCIFDYGPHAIHVQLEHVVDFARELLGADLLENRFRSRILFEGRYFDHPIGLREIFLGIDPLVSARSLLDFISMRIRQKISPSPDDSFAAWVRHRFGETLYRRYFGGYTEKVWGVKPDELAPNFASERIPVSSLWSVILKVCFGSLVKLRDERHAHSPYGRKFHYPRKGIGELTERMAEALAPRGGVLLERTVETVRLRHGRVHEVVVRGPGGAETIRPDNLLSTIPITEFVKLLDPPPSEEVLRAGEGLRYRGMIFVFLVVDSPRLSRYHWTYFSDRKFPINRVSEMKNFSEELAPKDKTHLVVEMTSNPGEELWESSGEDLIRIAVDHLQDIGYLEAGSVSAGKLEKTRYGYPLYLKGYDENLGIIQRHLDSIPNAFSFGRQGLFTYTNLDHAVDMGFKVADYLIQGAGFKKEITRKLLDGYILSY